MKPGAVLIHDASSLLRLFSSGNEAFTFEEVAATDVPEPYQQLLVHEHHMTVTVEAFHRDKVDVRVLANVEADDIYAREILLVLHRSGQVVQYGVMRIHFRHCSQEVRDAIVAGREPLGRILIEYDVLRKIQPQAYLRVTPGPAMMDWFGLSQPLTTYGRRAVIHCNGEPAVELLEIVAPARSAKES